MADPGQWRSTACILCSTNCGLQVQTDGGHFTRIRRPRSRLGTTLLAKRIEHLIPAFLGFQVFCMSSHEVNDFAARLQIRTMLDQGTDCTKSIAAGGEHQWRLVPYGFRCIDLGAGLNQLIDNPHIAGSSSKM